MDEIVMNVFEIGVRNWTIDELKSVIIEKKVLSISEEVKQRVQKCRDYLDQKVEQTDQLFYGVNTGFGSLCDTAIDIDSIAKLQENLVKSHACGVGDEVDSSIVKLMILLKIKGLSLGHSGVAFETLERLVWLYNEEVIPVVYQEGSLGASGDLAPLANMSLALIGEGKVYHKGIKKNITEVYDEAGIKPLALQSKEGLALLNGTQFMAAHLLHCVITGMSLLKWSNKIAALSIDAYDASLRPFNDLIHQVRPHRGQIEIAAEIRGLLEDSHNAGTVRPYVQDAYSFRCIPQVHGATLDVLYRVAEVLEREINSVTDNPTIFPDEDEIISAGNFHGQTLALHADFLAIALAELGSISERRLYKLVSGERGLPSYLVKNPGLNSGFMIVQYACAAVVSKNKQLCTPASIDSIDSSQGQEDHVSMGANAVVKLLAVTENLYKVFGMELFAATQAIEFRKLQETSSSNRELHTLVRNYVPFIEEDCVMHTEIDKCIQIIKDKL